MSFKDQEISRIIQILSEHVVAVYSDKWTCTCGVEVDLDDGVLSQVPPEYHIAEAILGENQADDYIKRAIVEP